MQDGDGLGAPRWLRVPYALKRNLKIELEILYLQLRKNLKRDASL